MAMHCKDCGNPLTGCWCEDDSLALDLRKRSALIFAKAALLTGTALTIIFLVLTIIFGLYREGRIWGWW